MQCQKALSVPWFTRHLLLFNWRTVSFCHSAVKRLYLLTCKSSIYILSADVTASSWLALTQCWLKIVHQLCHFSNIEPTLYQGIELPVFPAKMRPLANAVLQLSHGRRRWASLKLALDERLSVKSYIYSMAMLS